MCPTYDYCCNNCGHIQEDFHGMLEKPLVHCDKCRGACIKLMGTGSEIMGMNGGKATYDFVDFNTTGRPVRINSKRQWKEHLRRTNLNDDIQNTPFKKSHLDSLVAADQRTKKMVAKRELKKVIIESVKDKRHINEVKQKYARKGGK